MVENWNLGKPKDQRCINAFANAMANPYHLINKILRVGLRAALAYVMCITCQQSSRCRSSYEAVQTRCAFFRSRNDSDWTGWWKVAS